MNTTEKMYLLTYCYDNGCEKTGIFTTFEKAMEWAKVVLKRHYKISFTGLKKFHNSDISIMVNNEDGFFEFVKGNYIASLTISPYEIDTLEDW